MSNNMSNKTKNNYRKYSPQCLTKALYKQLKFIPFFNQPSTLNNLN